MPITLKEPRPGDTISAAWMRGLVDYVRSITPIQGRYVMLERTPLGTVIHGTPAGSAANGIGLKPFAMRWHVPVDDSGNKGDGQLEIYLPRGCMTVRTACNPINQQAKDASGHEDDGDDWYRIAMPSGAKEEAKYIAVVHGKQRVHVEAPSGSGQEGQGQGQAGAGQGEDEEPACSPHLLVWLQDESHKKEEELSGDEKSACAGDTVSQVVGYVTIAKNDKGELVPICSQLVSSPLSFDGEPDRAFDLYWELSITDDTLNVDKIGLLRRTLSAGAVIDIDSPDDAVVTDAKEGVYLKVSKEGETAKMEVVVDSSETVSGPDFFIEKLYSMTTNHRLAGDLRDSLWRLPYYL